MAETQWVEHENSVGEEKGNRLEYLSMHVLNLLLWSSVLAPMAPANSKAPLPCGIKLRPKAHDLQLYVEQHAHHGVHCEIVVGLGKQKGALGYSHLERGVPTIELDSVGGVNETDLTHELFHMKLAVTLPPSHDQIASFPHTARVRQLDQASRYLLAGDIYSYLEHRLFIKT